MGTIHRFGRTLVRVYGGDHLPPHFHVIFVNRQVRIEIDTLAIMNGDLGKERREIMAWAVANKAAIIAEWNRMNPRFPVR